MAGVFSAVEYGTQPTILFHPEGWSAFPHTFPQGDPLATQGIVLLDVDVSRGPGEGAIVYAGDIRLDRLPTAPTLDTKLALPRSAPHHVGMIPIQLLQERRHWSAPHHVGMIRTEEGRRGTG